MAFLDHEYPMWKAKMDTASNLPSNSVVILGDSRAMADLIPKTLGPDVVNFAVGGASTFEIYAFAKKVLSSPNPPRAIILSVSPFHFTVMDTLWDRGVKFGLFDWRTLDELRIRARAENEVVNSRNSIPNYADGKHIFGPETFFDIEAKIKVGLFSNRFPAYYFSAMVDGGFFLRKSKNLLIYKDVLNARGYHSFGTADGTQDLGPETKFPQFKPAPLLDHYFSETIQLFLKKNIPVFYITAPLNEVSVAKLDKHFSEAYVSYIQTFESRFSNFHITGTRFSSMPWRYYGDGSHLNEKGAEVFSAQVANWLKLTGVEN